MMTFCLYISIKKSCRFKTFYNNILGLYKPLVAVSYLKHENQKKKPAGTAKGSLKIRRCPGPG